MRKIDSFTLQFSGLQRVLELHNVQLECAISALDQLSGIVCCGYVENIAVFDSRQICYERHENEEYFIPVSMALVRRLLIDAQAKIRKMVEENRQIISGIEDDTYETREHDDFDDAATAATSRRLDQLSLNSSVIDTVSVSGRSANICDCTVPSQSQQQRYISGSSATTSSAQVNSESSNRGGGSAAANVKGGSKLYDEMSSSPISNYRYATSFSQSRIGGSSNRRSNNNNNSNSNNINNNNNSVSGNMVVLRSTTVDNNSSSSSSSGASNSGVPICDGSSGHNMILTSTTNTSDSKSGSYITDDANYVNRRRSRKSRRGHHQRRRPHDMDFQEDTEPPSPTPGPSTRNDYAYLESLGKMHGLDLDNERLKAEIQDLRRLLILQQQQQQQHHVVADDMDSTEDGELLLYQDLDPIERSQALEEEVIKARKIIRDIRSEALRYRKEKMIVNNELKRLYMALEIKDKQLREIIRAYEAKLRENKEALKAQKYDRDKERWNLLRHARDETERSLALAAQLDEKEQQLGVARRQLSAAAAGYYSDQESVVSATTFAKPHRTINTNGRMTPNPVSIIGGGLPDIGSCSMDSGVRGSSDRESAATSVGGGNLSDSTTDGTPTITIDNVHALQHRQHQRYIDADSISLISSSALPHIYQSVITPRDCSSPSISPLNMSSFSRCLDTSALSKSVEHLGSPPPELETINRRNKNLRNVGGSRSSVSSTWGSISRVFSRSRHRKTSSGSQDEENYSEKLRLLREAAHIPMERWRAPTVQAWIEIALSMSQYGARCAENIKSGKVLLELSDLEFENVLRMTNPLHRKKLRLAIEEHRNPSAIKYPCISQLDHNWVCNEWLPDIGLSHYAEIFGKNLVDARVLDALTKKEMEKYLNITRKCYQLSVTNAINLLRMVKYDRQTLTIRRHQCDNTYSDPLVWTNERFIQWARDIHLEEYADNLRDCGIHGAVVVLEPTFDGEMMADALEIPTSKQMIRRHLTAELEQLILPARYEVYAQSEPIYETPLYRTSAQQL